MLTWRQSSPATSTSRLSVSDSVSPRADGGDAVRHAVADRVEVERPVVRAEHAEVLHPGLAVAAEQPRRDLLDHPQAEVLERRHRLAELDLAARSCRARRACAPASFCSPTTNGSPSRSSRSKQRDVGDGERRLDARRGSTRGSAGPSARPARARAPGRRGDELLAQAVVPRARERDELAARARASGDVGHAVRAVHGDVDADLLALAEHGVRLDGVGAEAVAQQRAEARRASSGS